MRRLHRRHRPTPARSEAFLPGGPPVATEFSPQLAVPQQRRRGGGDSGDDSDDGDGALEGVALQALLMTFFRQLVEQVLDGQRKSLLALAVPPSYSGRDHNCPDSAVC